MKTLALAALLTLATSTDCLAWGDRGHSIVAEIALRHLNDPVYLEVERLLGKESLAGTASWADDYKFTDEGKHTYDWHFVDIDVSHDAYDASVDCKGANGCLVTALVDEAKILADRTKSDADRRQALLLLAHLVGDSTQPFHCTERHGDVGANKVKVDFEGKRPDGKLRPVPDTNLHAVWDDSLIDTRAFSWGSYAAEIDRTLVPGITDVSYGEGFAEQWVNQCHQVGQKLYQELPAANADGFIVIDETYQAAVKDRLDGQLAIGGLRLAAMLNSVLAGN
ncbi:S1/P1 nuclease [Mesorhizobium sophorae]|uniref:S1/P1 nuclease n=1 Tax=Mesorhizobium sophorae TaxID=1300294 RepID=UPI00142DA8A6|nr:S1/P1 nuclease [Mesorhizobium sophorae]